MPRGWEDDGDSFYGPTYGTGSAHGVTEKAPPKQPLGFAPTPPKVEIPPARRTRKR